MQGVIPTILHSEVRVPDLVSVVHYSKAASLAQPAAIMMQVLVMTYEEEDEEDEEDNAPTW